MEIKRLTVATIIKRLSECNQEAEVAVTLGNIPLCIPVETLSIRMNADDQEIVALVVSSETIAEVLNLGEQIIKGTS